MSNASGGQLRQWWRGVWLAGFVGIAWICAAPARADPIPLADFFRSPTLTEPQMSPSGVFVAALVTSEANKRKRLAILDLGDLSKSKIIAGFSDADITNVHWVNDERLVFEIVDSQAPYARQAGSGLYAVDREGTTVPRSLIKHRWLLFSRPSGPVDRELPADHRFYATVRDGSNDVVVAHYRFDSRDEFDGFSLLRLDTTDGRSRSISGGVPEHTFDWALDSSGQPRAVATQFEGKVRLYWKRTVDAPWSLVYEQPVLEDEGRGIEPLRVDVNDVLYYIGRTDPSDDKLSLMRLNLRDDHAQPQAVMSLQGYDFSGRLRLRNDGRLLGVDFLTDARSTHWFDAGLQAIQQQVDKLLPATNNTLDCGDCRQPATVLVTSRSDRQPAIFHLFDVKAGTLTRLGSSRPWIDPRTMAQRDMTRFAARDGLSIPVHVTRPAGSKASAPMVVLVHGGPYVRGGEWRWDGESQFLASRGYVVVEPEFRGSTGFGLQLFRAGWKQWGLAMQDDVTDAARWAIQQGYADPKRVCIAGASYGGYATLMGLIREPALFRCGVEWVGVSDIDLLFSINWSDFGEAWKLYGMPKLIGDPQKDAKQFAATSPLRQAARLGQPLLMAYGASDRRVPIDHGTRMRDALRATNPNVEWVTYADEGHGWMLEANQIDFWRRVETFLDKNLMRAP